MDGAGFNTFFPSTNPFQPLIDAYPLAIGIMLGLFLARRDDIPYLWNVRTELVRSTGQCNTFCSLSAGVSKPKVFRGR